MSERVLGEASLRRSFVEEEIRKHAKTFMQYHEQWHEISRKLHLRLRPNSKKKAGNLGELLDKITLENLVSVDVVLGVVAKGLFSAEKPPLKTISEEIKEWNIKNGKRLYELETMTAEMQKEWTAQERSSDDFQQLWVPAIEAREQFMAILSKHCVFDGTFPKSSEGGNQPPKAPFSKKAAPKTETKKP